MHQLISVFGKDRPGLVAGLTNLLYKHRVNLGDMEMTRLGGIFALLVEFKYPDNEEEPLQESLALFAEKKNLKINTVNAKPYEEQPLSIKPNTIITVYGADKPGIVFKITDILGQNNVNITNLETSLKEKNDLYLLFLEAQRPDEISLEKLKEKLETTAAELQINIKVRQLDAPAL